MDTFSRRHGLGPSEPPVTIQHDAPHELRGVVVDIAYENGMGPSSMRSLVCRQLRVREDPGNWSEYPNIDGEVRHHLDTCAWYEVYDIIEAIYRHTADISRRPPQQFESSLNDYFRRRGIGWQMINGLIQVRGSEAFEQSLTQAQQQLAVAGLETAEREIHEALRDLSRRPEPDLTGALHHGIAALECVAREVTGDPKATLGAIIANHPDLIPRPIDQAVAKMWGFASEKGRHIREGGSPNQEEVELTVQIAAAVTSYLVKKLPGSPKR